MRRVWFGRKRVGWGLRPVAWQGWVLTVVYLLLCYAAAEMFARHHIVFFAVGLIVLTVGYVVVAQATSSGR